MRPLLPISFLCLHTALVGLAVFIDRGPGWDDQSPTILVLILLAYLDYPVKLLFQSPSWWLIAGVGGAFWFGVGLVLQFGLRLISRLFGNSEGT